MPIKPLSTLCRGLLALAIAAGVVVNARAQAPIVVDRVIATVGGELVLLSELEEQVALTASQSGKAVSPAMRCTILEQILTAKLLVNQAKLDSVVVSEQEVEGQLNARIDKILQYMNGDVQQFEDYYGQTIAEVKQQFREDLEAQLLADRMRAKVVAEARITPTEVREFFETIPRDSLPYFNSEVELRELVYKPKVSEAARAVALERIETIRASIVEGGADFATLARKQSDDPGSARQGGELGWAPRGTFVPEFEAAAYRLDVNEVSDVVESPFGFHIIQLLERRGNRIRTRHVLIKPEIGADDLAKAERFLDSIRLAIVADSLGFRQAVSLHGDDKQQSFSNGGRVENPATGNTFFEIGDLDPVAFFAVDSMEVGGVSGPVKFEQPGQETIYRIFQLDSRSKPHRASLKSDYNKIRQAAVESRKSEILLAWVDRTIASTYIRVSPSLTADCNLAERWYTGGVVTIEP